MGRSGARSEYGKQYSPKRSMLSCNQTKVFENNRGYREYRRKMEHWHSHDPFSWDVKSPSRDRVGTPTGKRGSSSSSSAGEGDDSTPEEQFLWRRRDEAVQTPVDWREDDELPKTPPTPVSAERVRRKTAPPAVSDARVQRSQTPQPQKSQQPFLSYGHGYVGVETGDKRSFNVYAGKSAFPAALRAQKRRQAEIKLREKEAKKASSSRIRLRREEELFNERVARDTDRWTTEYRSHYPAHSRREYERNLSARKIGGVAFEAD